jgi:hypothetical protein
MNKSETLLNDMVMILFSGVEDCNGALLLTPDSNQFLESNVYNVVHKLSQEFPEVFPYYFTKNLNGIFYSKELEGILFSLSSLGIIRSGMYGNENCLTMELKIKRLVVENIIRDYPQEDLKRIFLIVKRFLELMEKNKGMVV